MKFCAWLNSKMKRAIRDPKIDVYGKLQTSNI